MDAASVREPAEAKRATLSTTATDQSRHRGSADALTTPTPTRWTTPQRARAAAALNGGTGAAGGRPARSRQPCKPTSTKAARGSPIPDVIDRVGRVETGHVRDVLAFTTPPGTVVRRADSSCRRGGRHFQQMGVVGVSRRISPVIASWAIAPALAAGNAVLVAASAADHDAAR